ncbi:hypothetical protein AN958_02409 [Leucoagaricus sp. SymC.cos]|nr:hypothetical protein AN958_02409 [Leucoagaricus sp. SymC.cos]
MHHISSFFPTFLILLSALNGPSPPLLGQRYYPPSSTSSPYSLILQGNQGLRYFPYTRYLGLTPIRVEGVVRTKLDPDLKLLPATSLTVSIRCYESRVGRVNLLHSNILVDHTQVLWSKSDDVEYEPIGNLDYPFRLTLPAKIGGFSTAVFVDYRCMWRVEAVLNHIPIGGVGSRQVKHFELPLVRYDLPAHIPLPPLPDPLLSQLASKPRAPRIRYSIDTPPNAIGPTDLVSIPIHVQPVDRAVCVRSASVVVERRIQLYDNTHAIPPQPSPTTSSVLSSSRSPSPPHSDFPASAFSTFVFSHPQTTQHLDTQHLDTLHVNSEGLASTSSLSSSNPTITPYSIFPSSNSVTSSTRPLLPLTSPPPPANASASSLHGKIINNTIVETESSGRFIRDENGVWNKTMTLQWPAVKSHSRWAVGETIQSDLVSVRYFVRVKVTVHSPSGTDTLELNEKEIFIVSTNNAERQLAITKYNEMLDLAHQEYRSKSKSPRRMRVDREELPPSPLPSTATISKADPTHMPSSRSSKSRSATRRPHTSAGPRDKPLGSSPPRMETSSFGGCPRDDLEEVAPRGEVFKKRRSSRLEEATSGRLRTDSGHPAETKRSGKSYFFSSSAPKMGSVPSGSSTTTTTSSSSISSDSHAGSLESDHMREWEAELAKIEMRSRRSSDLLGFARFLRKRPSTAVSTPRVMLPGCDAS